MPGKDLLQDMRYNVGKRFFSELENGKATLQIDKVLNVLEVLDINLYAVSRENDSGELR